MSSADEKSLPGDADVKLAPLEIDPAVERRVVRKLDMTVLIAFAMVFGINYLDKIGLSYAAIFGMKKDLALVKQDYSWTASIFYFGQAASEFVCLYLLHKLPIRSFVAVSIVVWAIVVACQAATKNFTDMMIVRFFLGFTEGAVAPAFVLMTSFFYRKREQPIRIAVFVSFNALAQIVGALLLYGCGSIKGGALKGWRISFLICAALTILIGIYFFIFVPKSPGQAWFLTPEEREVAVARVAQERASLAHSNVDRRQIRQTLLDVRFYIVFLWAFFVCITSVVTFGSIVVNGFGFTPFKTLLVGLPGPAVQLVTIWIGAGSLYLFPNARGWTQMALTLVPLTGVAMMRGLPYHNKWALTGAFWLATANSSVYVVNMSLIASNTKGHTRKTMFSLVYFLGYCVGCIAGPQLFLSYEAPLYRTAMNTIIGMYCAYLASMFLYREICRRENSRRDKLAAEGVEEAKPRLATHESNDTDIDDLAFRFVL
ncbi:hypothetical protein NBRC10512_005939 [Rhodotorula toruloides]|uniref:RHTO0S02e01552g1_1 n=2 Tax=Rhodotorula toruloides TaxID=5286 RepID=A0A061AM47_RHOTO|nr:major facilitator superfamily protein [Rhodotorula toruloides NP11]EMS22084.1 major facilitator superfamily protein [Rhodotorula toruloides NP11]CDR36393.1 RHTO0S02e01552g1_1 [Rhodotorula toruloides]